MVDPNETPHDRFLRIMQKRLGNALEQLRLISQLKAARYHNTPEEASEVVCYLDEAVKEIATKFEVPYKTSMGNDATSTVGPTSGPINELDIARAIDLLENDDDEDNFQNGLNLLRAAFNHEPR